MVLLQLLVNGVAMGSLYALVAVGFAVIFATTRVFHFAHGATYLLAAYAYHLCRAGWEWPVAAALVAATVVAVAFGVGADALVYRPMRRMEASFLTMFVASFGLLLVVENAIVLGFGNEFYTFDSSMSRSVPIGPVAVSPVAVVGVVTAAAVFAGLQWFLTRTRTGVLLRAIADDRDLVEVVGFDRHRLSRLAFAVGSALTVPAAVLIAYLSGLSPSVGVWAILVALTATIVGGVGSLPGAALGAMLLGVAENVGIFKLAANWKGAIAFGTLVVFMLLRPGGLFGAARR